MGWYAEHVLPWVNEKGLDRPDIAALRDRACAQLSGDVLEVGFGSGLNVKHYPPAITRILAIEPSAGARRKAGPRIEHSRVPVEFAGEDGQRLPLADGTADSALVTWVLCAIPDPVATAREIYRVLAPGGVVSFLEHGLSPDPAVVRWQRRLNPVNLRLAGCRLDRNAADILGRAGFVTDRLDTYYLEHVPRSNGYVYEGTVRKPAE
jgi:SAM-dependent methyltransferase